MGKRGYPKSRRKEQNQLICNSDKGERVSKNPKILQTSYMEAPRRYVNAILTTPDEKGISTKSGSLVGGQMGKGKESSTKVGKCRK